MSDDLEKALLKYLSVGFAIFATLMAVRFVLFVFNIGFSPRVW